MTGDYNQHSAFTIQRSSPYMGVGVSVRARMSVCNLHVATVTCVTSTDSVRRATQFTIGLLFFGLELRWVTAATKHPATTCKRIAALLILRLLFQFLDCVRVCVTCWEHACGFVCAPLRKIDRTTDPKYTRKSTIFIVWHTLKQLVLFYFYFKPIFSSPAVRRSFSCLFVIVSLFNDVGDCHTVDVESG